MAANPATPPQEASKSDHQTEVTKTFEEQSKVANAEEPQLEPQPEPQPQEKNPTDDAIQASPPTYASIKVSSEYKRANTQLQNGEFDAVLETLEESLAKTLALVGGDEVHDAMGPLYYLYGTALLYSVEETAQPEVVEQPAEGEVANDDLQIAWENLDSARFVLERMVSSESKDDALKLDLAQIYLRLGDLQKANGNYQESVQDYTKCLSLRQLLLGEYDRKVADVQYSLGTVCMRLAAVATQEDKTRHQASSTRHYMQCGRSIAGKIAFLCGKDEAFVKAMDEQAEEGGKIPALGKTTGLEEEKYCDVSASQNLKSYRSTLAKLETASSEDVDEVSDLKELLDEIQEGIDNSAQDLEGINEVAQMKAQAEAAANQEDMGGADAAAANGATTTIGFAASASASAAAATAMPLMIKKKKRPPGANPETEGKRAKTD